MHSNRNFFPRSGQFFRLLLLVVCLRYIYVYISLNYARNDLPVKTTSHRRTSPSICFANQFTVSYMTRVSTGSYLRTYFSMEVIDTTKTPQYLKNPLYSDEKGEVSPALL